MSIEAESQLITDFLGSAHIFAFAVEQVIEEQLWRDATGNEFSVQQLKILRLVSLSGTHTVSDVAAFLGVSNAAASKAIDKLARQMLLRRSEGERDRRSIHLSLTGAGRRVLSGLESVIRRKVSDVLGDYSREDLQRTIEMLDLLAGRLIGLHPKPDEICVQCGIYFLDKCLKQERLNRACLYSVQRERDRGRRVKVEHPADS